MRSPVIHAFFRFYSELNDFLRPEQRQREFRQAMAASDTVKHVIESLGVPHTEVQLVLVNAEPVGWEHQAPDCSRVSVYPAFTSLDLQGVSPVYQDASGDVRFILDGHLGRLSAYLRMLGFDTAYDRFADDEMLAGAAAAEDRILVTRDVGLLKRKNVRRGYFVRADDPRDQLRAMVVRFDLRNRITPFSRCMDCNGLLRGIEKHQVADRLPPHTRATRTEFSTCGNCGKIYWKGSHHSEMSSWIEELRTSP